MSKQQKQRPVLGSHQKCWLWGRTAVTETLRAGTWPIVELYLADNLRADQLDAAAQMALALDVPVKIETARRLEQLCHSPDHQGYLAKMSLFPYADAEAVLAKQAAQALYLVLDRIQDPHNFGAMVRSAEVFGAGAVFIGHQGQVGVTTAVARASAGAVNRVPIVQADDLVAAAARLREAGVALAGASEKAETPVTDFDFRRPAAVVIGSEAAGIRPQLAAACDTLVHIPQHGQIGSLNAAAAAAIVLYEARRQRAANA